MTDVLDLLVDGLDGWVGRQQLDESLDVGLIVLVGQQLLQDDAQAFAAGSDMGTLHMRSHHLLHLLATGFIGDAAGIQQTIVHL